jgi:glycerol kinase
LHPEEISAIGITNQRETTVVWNKNTGKPIYNAIVWQSRQTADLAEKLITDGYEDFILQKTGLKIDAYFSATKIRFILDHVDGAQEMAERGELLFGTIDSFLLWKLTDGDVHATDITNASRTMLFNIHTLDWDDEILSLLNIPRAILPDVRSNSEIYGYTKSYHFFGAVVPIAGMAGDQQAALIGQLGFNVGDVKNTYGTGAFLVMNIGEAPAISKNNLLTTIAYSINGHVNYALEGSIFIAGSVIQWLRDGLEFFSDSKESENLARNANDEENIYLVPAFTGLGAPYWDSEVRGAMFGLTRGTTKNDVTRAAIEAICYQTEDMLEAMRRDTDTPVRALKVDGGAALNNYLVQFQSDISDVEITRPSNLETTAMGACFLAGLAVGVWSDVEELKQHISSSTKFEPEMNEETRVAKLTGWHKSVKAAQMFK